MSRKTAFRILLGAGVTLIAALAIFALRSRQVALNTRPSTDTPVASSSIEEAYDAMDEKQREAVKTGLQGVLGRLGEVGLKPTPRVERVLADAVATGDRKEVLRAFSDAVYARFSSMDKSLPALRRYLGSEEPYIRYFAAKSLLIAGDPSGVGSLLEILSKPERIPHRLSETEFDLRDMSAELLGKFRIKEGIPFLLDYYNRTGSGDAVGALTRLGVAVGEWSETYRGASEAGGYAMVDLQVYTPQLRETFSQPIELVSKNTVAWALARMTGEPEYVHHLIEASLPATEAPDDRGAGDFNTSLKALRYLGTIQSPEAVAALERALASGNPRASSVALVNLLFNQREPSQKARQMLLEQLEGTASHRIYPELAVRLVAALGDPELSEAAARAERRTSAYAWRYWGIERANWPVENWIYDYVETLNRK